MDYQFICYAVDAGVAVLTLNRPDVLNSPHGPMAEEGIEAIGSTAAVRAVLRTSQGRAL
ncbi:hypothetical protein [Rhodocaloribacter sp.]